MFGGVAILRVACRILVGAGFWLVTTAGSAAEVRSLVFAPVHVYPELEFIARVELDASIPGPTVGSYGLRLTWDPARCAYVADEAGNGSTALSSPTVNRLDAPNGTLRWSAADAQGAAGSFEVLRITFRPSNQVGAGCTFSTAFDSLYEALTYDDLMPIANAGAATSEIRDAGESLTASSTLAGTAFRWSPFPGATSYDVVRGSLAAIDEDSIGPLDCVEGNSSDTTTAGGHEDPSTPAEGDPFFYLLQADDGGYGNASSGEPRIPSSGGCP